MPFVSLMKVREPQLNSTISCTDSMCWISQRKLITTGTSVFSRDLPYSEIDALTSLLPYIKSSMKLQDITVVSVEDALSQIEKSETQGEGWDKATIERSEPESPQILFWNC